MLMDIKKVKIAVMVPEESVSEVRDAICNAGCGYIGNYYYCTTATEVMGTFVGNEDSNPYIGKKEEVEYCREIKLEAVCNIEKTRKVLDIIRKIHPYEEPAIDIYPLICEEDIKV